MNCKQPIYSRGPPIIAIAWGLSVLHFARFSGLFPIADIRPVVAKVFAIMAMVVASGAVLHALCSKSAKYLAYVITTIIAGSTVVVWPHGFSALVVSFSAAATVFAIVLPVQVCLLYQSSGAVPVGLTVQVAISSLMVLPVFAGIGVLGCGCWFLVATGIFAVAYIVQIRTSDASVFALASVVVAATVCAIAKGVQKVANPLLLGKEELVRMGASVVYRNVMCGAFVVCVVMIFSAVYVRRDESRRGAVAYVIMHIVLLLGYGVIGAQSLWMASK